MAATELGKNASYGLIKLYLKNDITPKEAEDKIRQFIMKDIGYIEQIEIVTGSSSAI